MITVVIVGGRLQGTELAFLCGEAGFRRILIDREKDTPASGLCEESHVLDVTDEGDAATLRKLFAAADIILPALENEEALESLVRLTADCGVPFAFDFDAYLVSSSKLKSDDLFRSLGISAPKYDPTSGACLVKPSESSGSVGVRVFSEPSAAHSYIESLPEAERESMVLQEYVEGRSYSVEVIGRPGNYRTFAITEIHTDSALDCNRVTTPCELPLAAETAFKEAAVRVAEAIGLDGIMDAEAIFSDGEMKMLEVDARFPSQTPSTIYASTGVNMAAELVHLFIGSSPGEAAEDEAADIKFASYENILVSETALVSLGEHIMGGEKQLSLHRNYFGADIALVGIKAGRTEYGGIYINAAATEDLLEIKRAEMYSKLIGNA